MIYLNGQLLDFSKFPNGETNVNGKVIKSALAERQGDPHITFKYLEDGDLIKLLFVKKFIDNYLPNTQLTLTIAYMPYSRMDRVEGDSVFTLKYVSEFVNSLNFKRIYVLEPHSDVTCALLDRSIPSNETRWLVNDAVLKVGFDRDKDYLLFPDAGAQKRYSNLIGFKSVVGHKHRDFTTGKITSLEIVGETDKLVGRKVIIVDDLCSRGGTFFGIDNDCKEFGAAAELKKLGASEIYLVVTHCEKTIFDGNIFELRSPISKVFTTNTIIDSYTAELTDGKLSVHEVI